MTKQTKILTGVLAGAALGAGIALVLSAGNDNELKSRMNDWFCRLLDQSKDALNNASEKLQQRVAQIKS